MGIHSTLQYSCTSAAGSWINVAGVKNTVFLNEQKLQGLKLFCGRGISFFCFYQMLLTRFI